MIQVIERFHKIITYVSDKGGTPCAAKELAEFLGVSPPTCSNILRTMCDLGWLESSEGVRGYVLGPTIFKLAKGMHYRQEVLEVATPIVADLCDSIGEYVNLVVNQNGRRLVLLHSQPDREIILSPDASSGCDLYQHATGLVLLAYMNPDQRKRYFKAFGQPDGCPLKTVGNTDDLEAECSKVRTRGYAEIAPKRESRDKVTVLAFPVLDGGTCEMAIGIQIPGFRFDDSIRKRVITAARHAARRISRSCS